MKKPSWNNAPKWASYLAQDNNNNWFWFQNLPLREKKTKEWVNSTGKYEIATKEQVEKVSWSDTLEDRRLGFIRK